MSNGTKRLIEIMSKVRNANWDIMSNGKKMLNGNNVESKKCRMGHNVEWDIMLNGTKMSTGNNV